LSFISLPYATYVGAYVIDYAGKAWHWPAPHSGANFYFLAVGVEVGIGIGVDLFIRETRMNRLQN
jgi:hypothetical protein